MGCKTIRTQIAEEKNDENHKRAKGFKTAAGREGNAERRAVPF
jgi:hypothetical protein